MAALDIELVQGAPPGVKVFWLPGDVLVVAIYPDVNHGLIYRWDYGLEMAPKVTIWQAPNRRGT